MLAMLNLFASQANSENPNLAPSSEWQIENEPSSSRQHFKINVAPKKVQRNKQAAELMNRRATGVADSPNSQSPATDPLSNDVPILNTTTNKQKISNATLKKLLNQSLLNRSTSASNSSSASDKSNFKFVFIQRATAAPGAVKSQQREQSTPQPSLAASVSKKLASSLLKSAVDIVADNLDSAKPSLSALASQLAAASSGTNVNSIFNSVEATKTLEQGDTKTGNALEKQKNVTRKGSAKVKQPSKIYNLPVKFVSNGQPNHVMFSTIKQHLATIKRIQQVAASASKSSSVLNQNANRGGNQGKRRKQQQHQKVKGNSRLIYLPLKYLSNAKPNRIISSTSSNKATHKSSLS